MNSRSTKKKALSACKKRSSLDEWILDSEARGHMCRDESVLVDAKQMSQSMFVADASEIPIVATGNVELDADVDTGKQFEDFLRASGLRHETSMPHNLG